MSSVFLLECQTSSWSPTSHLNTDRFVSNLKTEKPTCILPGNLFSIKVFARILSISLIFKRHKLTTLSQSMMQQGTANPGGWRATHTFTSSPKVRLLGFPKPTNPHQQKRIPNQPTVTAQEVRTTPCTLSAPSSKS